MEKYNRNHFLTVIDDFASSLLKSIIPMFVLFFGKLREKDDSALSTILVWGFFFTVILLLALFAFLKWYKKGYYIENRFIIMRSGLFFVKRREIPFNKIQTINLSQNLLQRVFRLAEMKIDTGNSSYNASELSIKIRKTDAERIRSMILQTKTEMEYEVRTEELTNEAGASQEATAETETSWAFRISGKELLVAGLTSNAVFAGLAFLASIYGMLNDFLSSVIEKSLTGLEQYIGSQDFGHMPVSRIITIVVVFFLIFLLFSLFLSIAGTYVKFFGFSVKREQNHIVISYGLLEKKNYIIPATKVKAVYIRQNLLRQFTGLYTIHIESIGYGNENGEEAVLFPVASASKKREILQRLFPEYLFEGEMVPVPKTSFGRFLRSKSMLPLIVLLIPAFLLPYGWLGLFLVPIFVLAGFMEYRNSAVGVDNGLICLNNGSFTRKSSLISAADIQSVADRSNFLQKRKGLFNYIVSIQSNFFGQTIQVKNLSESLKESLMSIHLD